MEFIQRIRRMDGVHVDFSGRRGGERKEGRSVSVCLRGRRQTRHSRAKNSQSDIKKYLHEKCSSIILSLPRACRRRKRIDIEQCELYGSGRKAKRMS